VSNIWNHVGQADAYIERAHHLAGAQQTPELLLQMAQVHATLALAHAIREHGREEETPTVIE